MSTVIAKGNVVNNPSLNDIGRAHFVRCTATGATQTIEIRGQKIEMEKGRLHKDLGIPEERKIPMTLLRKLVKVPNGEMFEHHGKNKKMTAPLKKRISLAITLKGFKK